MGAHLGWAGDPWEEEGHQGEEGELREEEEKKEVGEQQEEAEKEAGQQFWRAKGFASVEAEGMLFGEGALSFWGQLEAQEQAQGLPF